MFTWIDIVVLAIGFAGQGCYFMRMLWQWIVSERRQASVLPLAFWYWSLAGSILLLIYAAIRRDPVFIVGQSIGFVVYTRNLMLWYRRPDQSGSVVRTMERRQAA